MANLVAVTLQDSFGRTTTKRYETDASTVTNAQTYTDALLLDLAAISDLGHNKAIFEVPLTITVPVAPVSGANIDVGATLHGVLTDGSGYGQRIPGIKYSLVDVNGHVSPDVQPLLNWAANFESGGHWLVSDGETLDHIQSGELDK